MFNAGHGGPTEGMLRVMAASVMAVAGVGLIQTKKKNTSDGMECAEKTEPRSSSRTRALAEFS